MSKGMKGLTNYKFQVVDFNGNPIPSGLSVTICDSTYTALTIYKEDQSTSLTNPILSAALDVTTSAEVSFWYSPGGVYAIIDDGPNITRYGPIYPYDHRVVVPYLNIAAGQTQAITTDGEDHFISHAWTATLSSGDSAVGMNLVLTVAGTAGSWASPLYCKLVQSSTKSVNGYYCAAEFETVNEADNQSDNFVIVLNGNNSGANTGSHGSYMALRDYGSTAMNSLFWIADSTIGTTSPSSLVSTATDRAATHNIRFIAGSTVLYLLATTTVPS